MKIRLQRLAAIVIVISIGMVGMFRLGFVAGKRTGGRGTSALLHESGFVASFGALRRLRAGEEADAIHGLEAFCYSSAVALLECPDLRSNVVGSWYRDDLLKYRSVYAGPQSLQDPTEQRLDLLLGTNSLAGRGL